MAGKKTVRFATNLTSHFAHTKTTGFSHSGGKVYSAVPVKGGLKRHRKLVKDSIMGITKSDIRRCARRGGIARISGGFYAETRAAIRDYLTQVLKDVHLIVTHCNRNTVKATDVILALKRQGRPIYGFGDEN